MADPFLYRWMTNLDLRARNYVPIIYLAIPGERWGVEVAITMVRFQAPAIPSRMQYGGIPSRHQSNLGWILFSTFSSVNSQWIGAKHRTSMCMSNYKMESGILEIRQDTIYCLPLSHSASDNLLYFFEPFLGQKVEIFERYYSARW